MDYKCHDELIIVLLFTIMKQGAEHDPPLSAESAAFYVGPGHARGQMWPSGH